MVDIAAAMRAEDEAEERREQPREKEARDDWHNAAASEPDPWGDMEGSAAVDNPAQSVVHADARGLVSIFVPADSGTPCTECHAQHRGVCSFHDLLRADMNRLKMYADVFLPHGPEFYCYRGALYTIMSHIHDALAQGGITAEIFGNLRVIVRCMIEECDQLPLLQPGA